LSERYDVIVSGYGLTGIAIAALVSRRGHRVAVLERQPSMYGLPRMATIDSEGCRVVQAASGNADYALRNTVANPRYALANRDSEILMEADWRGVDVSGFPVRSSMYQPDIEEAMDAQARANGVDVFQGWEVAGLVQHEDRVVVTARERIVSASGGVTWGEPREFVASYVVGADGARSAIRTALGIEREGWPFRGAWLTIDMESPRARLAVCGS